MDEINQYPGSPAYNLIIRFAKRLWPELDELSGQRQLVGAGDVVTFFYGLPMAIAGLYWLVRITDLSLISNNWLFFIFYLGLIFLFSRVSYYIIIEIRTDRYGSTEESLATMIQWSALFLLGPTAIWMMVIFLITNFINLLRHSTTKAARWSLLRNLSFSMGMNTLAVLLALEIFRVLGGIVPIDELNITFILRGLAALVTYFAIITAIWSGYILYHLGVQRVIATDKTIEPILKFFLLSIGLSFLAQPFSLLVAGLYVQNGFALYIFLLVGLLLVAFLGRQLSWVAESNRQQSRQLEQLERLSRALLEAVPDSTILPQILAEHVTNMFPSGHVTIWIAPDTILLDHPEDWPSISEQIWDWLIHQEEPFAFRSNDPLPWEPAKNDHPAIITSPIRERGTATILGGICIELRTLAQPWDRRSLANLFPATLSLADQIASTLHQAKVYQQSLEYQQISQELRLAGKIQSSFLPNKFPAFPGWQLAVTLLPARETSGDYFDVIELGDNRLGILIADVADKGIGSALYMALSRTLIRTYAEEYDAEPEVVFFAANNRLLKDARANLFITAFYGILNLDDGVLTYCNAGHNPPYLIRADQSGTVEALSRTGIPMGIEENSTWTKESVAILTGDVLLLFTDGIPDAQNDQGTFFDDESILEAARENIGRMAYEIQSEILKSVQNFVGNSPQSDDITLMVLIRE